MKPDGEIECTPTETEEVEERRRRVGGGGAAFWLDLFLHGVLPPADEATGREAEILQPLLS